MINLGFRLSVFWLFTFLFLCYLVFSFLCSVLNSISSQKTLSNNINFILTILKSQRQIYDFLGFIVSFWWKRLCKISDCFSLYLKLYWWQNLPLVQPGEHSVNNAHSAPWWSGYHHCTTSFTKAWKQVLRRFKSCSQCVGDSRWWGSLTMDPAGNKALPFVGQPYHKNRSRSSLRLNLKSNQRSNLK